MNPTIQRIGGNTRLSQIVIHRETVYLAGQTSQLVEGDIRAQALDIFAKIDALLDKAGTHKSNMLSAQIWLTDMGDFEPMNLMWEAWLNGAIPPVRACVQAGFAKPSYLIEVQVIAALPEQV